MNEQQPAKRRKGCLFFGCMGGLVMLLLIALGGLFGLRYFKRVVRDFTDSSASPMPAVKMSPEQVKQIRERLENFKKSVIEHRATGPLTVTVDELNSLIQNDPDLQPLNGKIYILGIETNRLSAQLAVAMEELGLQTFKGRFLNATGVFSASIRYGALKVTPQELTVKGKPLPDVYMGTVRKQNLATQINKNPRASVALDWIEDIQLRDGKLVIVPKQNPGSSAVQLPIIWAKEIPRNSNKRRIVSSIKLFGHDAPAVTPTVTLPGGSQFGVSISSCRCWS